MMFQNEVMVDRAAKGMTILKVQAGSEVKLTIQSEAVVWAGTHWFHRQLWCAGEGCPACESSTVRQKGYFIAQLEMPQSSLYTLVECVPQAIQRFMEQVKFENEEWKPGVRMLAKRPARNRAVQFDLDGYDGTVIQGLTPMGRALSAAAVVHGLPPIMPTEELEEYSKRCEPIAKKLLLKAMSS